MLASLTTQGGLEGLFEQGNLAWTLALGGSLAVVLGALGAAFALRLWSRARGPALRLSATLAVSLAVALCVTGGYALWIRLRPQPSPRTHAVRPGIVIDRATRTHPRPMVIHTATVDLARPELRVVTTPPPVGTDLPARTTSAFVREVGAWVAINGQFFKPFHSNHPLDFYPRQGDPVRPVRLATARGRVYVEGTGKRATLYVTEDHEVGIGPPPERIREALTGGTLLVADGAIRSGLGRQTLAPRSAVGLSYDRQTLVLMVVDGRQPSYSEGATIEELATLMLEAGAHDAFELDGGGSSTLVTGDGSGSAHVLNCPVHTGLPCRERPVANHLGVLVIGQD